jgi:modulator of FtsH protease HflC
MSIKSQLLIIPILLLLFVGYLSTYVVKETEQVIITKFGKIVDDVLWTENPVTEPGLYFKLPFIHEVNRLEKRFLPWDGRPERMLTKEQQYLIIDTYARWRIIDPVEYFTSLRDVRRAISRINDILEAATKSAVANHELVQIFRSEPGRPLDSNQSLAEAGEGSTVLEGNKTGRNEIQAEILAKAAPKLLEFGIELKDVRFKRINYAVGVRDHIFERMRTERKQIAAEKRSEGAGEAAKIKGEKVKKLRELTSEAYREVEEIRGKADANASRIYAEAYNKSPQAASFYEFTKTLAIYQDILNSDTSLILTTDSPLFRLFKSLESSTGPEEGE